MEGNGHNQLEGLPHIDIVIRMYPSLNGQVDVTAPAQLAPFQVLGMLEIAKTAYYDGVKQMQKDSRIVVPAAMPKIAS
jgi:hypothetical protein